MDVHTHSFFSYDGKQSMESLVEAAKARGMKYVAVTEHLDLDLTALGYTYHKLPDLDGYFCELKRLRETNPAMRLLSGIELGYAPESDSAYAEYLSGYSFDVIINSVHMVDGEDIYEKSYYEKRNRQEAYLTYLKTVRKSLDVPYRYDVVGHIGYIARRSPYENPVYSYDEFPEAIDDVLEAVIAKKKCLEINSLTPSGADFSPDLSVYKRYRELGGSLVSFGSDAHVSARVGEKLDQTKAALKELGFRSVYVFEKHTPVAVTL